MSFIDKIANVVINNVKVNSEDELQERTLYQSHAIAYWTLPASLYFIGAILAWALPGYYSLLSGLVLIPLLVADNVASAWLKPRMPRPKAARGSLYYAFTFVPLAIMIAGLAFKLSSESSSSAIGVVTGAIGGGIVAALFTPRILRKRSAEDKQRLDSEPDDNFPNQAQQL